MRARAPCQVGLRIAEALGAWIEKKLPQVAGGWSIAQAIQYALDRWDGLVRFLDDGPIQIESNTVERAMRPIALGRRAWLFADSTGAVSVLPRSTA